MALRVVGAGMGRTGTHSLKVALERLLGGPCHHMTAVFARPEELPVWRAAAEGSMPDWTAFLADFAATCDWPSAAFWPELAAAFPEAIVVLSERDADSWYRSASDTIFFPLRDSLAKAPGDDAWADMVRAIFRERFTLDIDDAETCKRRFVENNEQAKREIDPCRLVVWQAHDGWEPLCSALGVDIPDEPFPVTNTTNDFQAMLRGERRSTDDL